MVAAAPAPDNGNGLEVSSPMLGKLRMAGRDLLLAAVLLVLGVASITVQWMTLTAFEAAFARDVTRVFAQADRAQDERDHMIALLRLRTCTETFLDAARDARPAVREQIERTWTQVCFAARPHAPSQPEPTR